MAQNIIHAHIDRGGHRKRPSLLAFEVLQGLGLLVHCSLNRRSPLWRQLWSELETSPYRGAVLSERPESPADQTTKHRKRHTAAACP